MISFIFTLTTVIVLGSIALWETFTKESLQRNTKLLISSGLMLVLLINIMLTFMSYFESKNKEQTLADLLLATSSQQTNVNQLVDRSSELADISKSQLRASMFSAAIDEKIDRMRFRISLDKRHSFTNLCPMAFGMSIWTSDLSNNTSQNYRVLFTDDYQWKGFKDTKTRIECYKSHCFNDDAYHKTTLGYTRQSLDYIYVDIPFSGNKDRLIYSLRDLQHSSVNVYLSTNLYPLVSRIQLIVNTWGIIDFEKADIAWSVKDISWAPYTNLCMYYNSKCGPANINQSGHPGNIFLYGSVPLHIPY